MNFHYRQLLKGTTLLSVSGLLRKGVGFLPCGTALIFVVGSALAVGAIAVVFSKPAAT